MALSQHFNNDIKLFEFKTISLKFLEIEKMSKNKLFSRIFFNYLAES